MNKHKTRTNIHSSAHAEKTRSIQRYEARASKKTRSESSQLADATAKAEAAPAQSKSITPDKYMMDEWAMQQRVGLATWQGSTSVHLPTNTSLSASRRTQPSDETIVSRLARFPYFQVATFSHTQQAQNT
jgi:hypothetical protein